MKDLSVFVFSRKALFLLSSAIAISVVCSCTRTADIIATPAVDFQQAEATLEERTEQLFSSLFGGNLRNGETATLSSLDSMETDDSETQLYLANFAGGGYLLFRDGGKEQMNVIGMSDNASLRFSDAVENPILGQIFQASASGLQDVSTDFDVLGPSGPRPPHIPTDYYPKEVVDSVYPSYLNEAFKPNTYQYFRQEWPFNCYIYKKASVHETFPAGCGPIAIVTLLSHYEMQAGGSNVDWKRLKDRYNGNDPNYSSLVQDKELIHQLRLLVKDAWKYAHIWTTSSFTMSTPKNVAGYLRRAGFNVAYDKKYDPRAICRILEEKHQPFILLGWARDSDGKQGHYWVVDGVAYREYKKTGRIYKYLGDTGTPFERTTRKPYIHCNWGWHGDSNGWFTPWVINENQGTPTLRSSRPYGEYYDISTFHIWK